jgi:hypothetical protein
LRSLAAVRPISSALELFPICRTTFTGEITE